MKNTERSNVKQIHDDQSILLMKFSECMSPDISGGFARIIVKQTLMSLFSLCQYSGLSFDWTDTSLIR